MGGMEKTTVYLTEAQKAALAKAAAVEGRSEATLIRAGIEVVTARHRAAEAAVPLAGSMAGTPLAEDPLATRAAEPPGRPRWLARGTFIAQVLRHQADPGLRDELRAIEPDTTDDEPLP